jgi:flagellar protein FlgJ
MSAHPITGIGVRLELRNLNSSLTPIPPESRAPSPDDARLKKTAQQLEGVFVEQLFKAMRDTVPHGEGAFDGGNGEDMFTGLMDQHLAADTPTQWAHGLAEAAYKQLRTALPGAKAAEDATPTPVTSPTPLTR